MHKKKNAENAGYKLLVCSAHDGFLSHNMLVSMKLHIFETFQTFIRVLKCEQTIYLLSEVLNISVHG